MQGDSVAAVESSGSVAAVPTLLSYELQAVQTTAGSGFKSALSLPVRRFSGRRAGAVNLPMP